MSGTANPGKDRAAARERWRRWNERDRAGVHVVPVEVSDLLLGRMLDLGLLAERDSHSREKVGRAICLYLANAFGDDGRSAQQGADDNAPAP